MKTLTLMLLLAASSRAQQESILPSPMQRPMQQEAAAKTQQAELRAAD